MTYTEFVKKYVPDYKNRELEMIQFYAKTESNLHMNRLIELWREQLFPEALENYTKIIKNEVD
jgi:hypothetical protein